MADLAGKKAGFTAPKSTSEILLRLALKETHLTGKVEPVATGGFGPGITALTTGAIQAAPMIDPTLTLDAAKYRVILPFANIIPRMTWLVGITTRPFAKSNPELLRKLIAVRSRGVDFIYNNRDEAMRIYAKVWQQEPSRSQLISRNISAMRANGRMASSKSLGSTRCRKACSSSARSTSRSIGNRSSINSSCLKDMPRNF